MTTLQWLWKVVNGIFVKDTWIHGDTNDDNSGSSRRLSNRKRKPVNTLSPEEVKKSGGNRSRGKQPAQVRCSNSSNGGSLISYSSLQSPTDSIRRFRVGTEIVLNCGVKENPSFNGEVFVVKSILKDGSYVLEMANSCFGLWGGPVTKSQLFMDRHATEVRVSENTQLIPLEFSLQNAVYDTRSDGNAVVPASTTLLGWRWLENWQKLTWTTQPMYFTYQHIYGLCKASIRDGFDPNTEYSHELVAHFILPPLGGSAALVRQYAAACERGEDKFVVVFEYGWIYQDAQRCKKKRSQASGRRGK